MAIVDEIRTKKIVVQTDNGQIFLHEDFSIQDHNPFAGFVRIEDRVDNRIFWFNMAAITWIGPRE